MVKVSFSGDLAAMYQGSPKSEFTQSAFFILLMGCLTALDPLSIDMYLPAFPEMATAFGVSIGKIELSVSTFFVGMALGQLVYGPLSDRFGRRIPLLGGMVLFFASSIGCALAPNVELFILCRLLQALGGCAGMVITRAIVRDLFDERRVAEFLSSMALVMGLAPILAPNLGSIVSAAAGWRGIFFFLAGANLLAMAAIFFFLPETNPKPAARMGIGQTLKNYGSLLRDREFLAFLAPDAAIRAGMFAYIAGSPFVFIELFGVPKNQFGLIFGANGIGLILASQINRRLLRKYQPRAILNWSVRLAALAAVITFIAPMLSHNAFATLVPLFFFLASLNFIGPNALAGALAKQKSRAGTASALYGCLQWSLASLASSLVSVLHNGSVFPMTGVILGCGLASLTAFTILGRKNVKRGVIPAVPGMEEPGL